MCPTNIKWEAEESNQSRKPMSAEFHLESIDFEGRSQSYLETHTTKYQSHYIIYLGGRIEKERELVMAKQQEKQWGREIPTGRWLKVSISNYGCIADLKEKQKMDGSVCCGDGGDWQWCLKREERFWILRRKRGSR